MRHFSWTHDPLNWKVRHERLCAAAIDAASSGIELTEAFRVSGLSALHYTVQDLETAVARRREALSVLENVRSAQATGRALLHALHASGDHSVGAIQLLTNSEAATLGRAVGADAATEYINAIPTEDLLSLRGHRRDYLRGLVSDSPYFYERWTHFHHMGVMLCWPATEALLLLAAAGEGLLAEAFGRIPADAAVAFVNHIALEQPHALLHYFDSEIPAVRAAAIRAASERPALPLRGDANEVCGMLNHGSPGAREALAELIVHWERTKSEDERRVRELSERLANLVTRDPEILMAEAQKFDDRFGSRDVRAAVMRAAWTRSPPQAREAALALEALRADDRVRWRALRVLGVDEGVTAERMYARVAEHVATRAAAGEVIFDHEMLEAAAQGFVRKANGDLSTYATETTSLLDQIVDRLRYYRIGYATPELMLAVLRTLAWLHVDETQIAGAARWVTDVVRSVRPLGLAHTGLDVLARGIVTHAEGDLVSALVAATIESEADPFMWALWAPTDATARANYCQLAHPHFHGTSAFLVNAAQAPVRFEILACLIESGCSRCIEAALRRLQSCAPGPPQALADALLTPGATHGSLTRAARAWMAVPVSRGEFRRLRRAVFEYVRTFDHTTIDLVEYEQWWTRWMEREQLVERDHEVDTWLRGAG